ncbi:TrkH family potassium uptake protein [Hydrogenimonas urashimensis]|uniref:TrkH family potassium uptake protein n=1 Tax=Hydrogenimonas urashimensis TaxID=2740515 RepID=UPI0019168E3E|nr:TrkH family potassium uptake protein [Hydrogenimonas urashimensis]
MDFRSIFKVLSLIGMTLGLFFTLDILVGLLFGEPVTKLFLFDLSFILLNLAIFLILRKYTVVLHIRESILAVNMLWILIGIAGAVPLLLYTPVTFPSAFFEAISGFTTTGATVYTDIEALPHMILFHRSLMHWLGGVGIIVLGVGLLSVINPTGSLSLFKAEATGIQIEKLRPKIKDTALSLWGIYLFLTTIDVVLLRFFGMGWFDAVNHAFSTLSTGGFSTKNSSLGYFESPWIIWTTTLFMMLSGINFLAHLKLFYRDTSGYRSEEVRWYVTIFLALGTLLTLVHIDIGGDTFFHAATHAFFTIASVMTTTGFATIDYGTWSHLAVALIFIAMLVGGNAGSTAGGIKVIRYVVIFKTLFAELKRILHPKAFISVFIDGIKLERNILASTFGFFVLFVFTVGIMSVYIYARGYDEMTAISGAVAIVGNVGPGFGHVGPAENFGFFNDIDKLVLSFGMIVGRLECYTVFILFTSSFWKRF